MRVEVGTAMWSDQQCHLDLRRLMMRAAEGQHEVDTADPMAAVASSFFTAAVAPADQVEWRELLTNVLGAARHQPIPAIKAQACLTIRQSSRSLRTGFLVEATQLGRWAEQPLTVLLENHSDALLLEYVAERSVQVTNALAMGWLVQDGRGGAGEVRRAMDRSVPGLRVVAVLDSDKDQWTAFPKDHRLNCRAEAENDIPLHVLAGRELENYVPKSCFQFGRLGNSTPARQARENHLWRSLLRLLEANSADLRRRHGGDAYAKVRNVVEAKQSRAATRASEASLFRQHLELAPHSRAVDDLKARLGERSCRRAVATAAQRKADGVPSNVDACLDHDLARLARLLEDWL